MQKELLQPLSGFRDNQNQAKPWVIGELQAAFQQFGYQALETPALERQEILLGKLGDEGEKQLYLFEDNGKRKVGLRYDLTVPLARFVAGNIGTLTLPYKRFEIGPSWRAEKPQKGRYRQFWQADVDVIGTSGLGAEKEALELAGLVEKKLGLKLKYVINDRRIVASIFEEMKINDTDRRRLLLLLDKKEKLSEEEFETELRTIEITDVQRRKVVSLFLRSEDGALDRLQEFLGEKDEIKDLQELITFGKALNLNVVFVPTMVRGLDYYTGTILEAVAEGYSGSVMGGGRYDSLLESLNGQKIPAFGISFGVDRLTDILSEKEMDRPAFIVNIPESEGAVRAWAEKERVQGKSIELFVDSGVDMGKQIKYADKRGYKKIFIPLEEAWKEGLIVERNLETGQQHSIKRDEIHG